MTIEQAPWIEWTGGKCPVERGVCVNIRLRDPQPECENWERVGSVLNWRHFAGESDIVAYRVVQS